MPSIEKNANLHHDLLFLYCQTQQSKNVNHKLELVNIVDYNVATYFYLVFWNTTVNHIILNNINENIINFHI